MKNLLKIKNQVNISLVITTVICVIGVIIFWGRVAFDVSKSFKYNLYFCVPLVCIIISFIFLAYIFICNRKVSYACIYVVLALCWGVTMQFVMPPISGSDEPNHVYSAFHAANRIMGIEDYGLGPDGQWIYGESYFPIREDEANGIQLVDLNLPAQYGIIADGGWFKCVGNEYTECHYEPNEWKRYIFSALGIVVARALNWGFSGTIMLGRLVNTFIFVFVGWICIKLLPVGKLQAISYALLPAVLNLTNSYSYDNMSIMFSFLFLSLCLHYADEETNTHIWSLYILAVVMVLLVPNKFVYVCFALWIFVIPLKKWLTIITSKKWYEYAGILGIILGAKVVYDKFFYKYFFITDRFLTEKVAADGIEQDVSRPSYTWAYIKDNVWDTIKFSLNGIRIDFWYTIKHVVGSELGLIKLNAPVPTTLIIIFLLILAVSFWVSKGEKLDRRQLLVIIIGALACLVAIYIGCLVRFTPTEGTPRVQVSYRYLEPVYMALIIAFGSRAKENKKSVILLYIENIALAITMCNILLFMLTR